MLRQNGRSEKCVPQNLNWKTSRMALLQDIEEAFVYDSFELVREDKVNVDLVWGRHIRLL